MLNKSSFVNQLKHSKLFYSLTDIEINQFIAKMYYCEFEKNQTLVYEGEMGNELYIILSGSVFISVMSENEIIDLATISCGSFFGEMAMLEEEPRSATCKAISDVQCLVLKSKDFLGMIKTIPYITSKILTNMLSITSNRMITTNSFLTEVVQWGADAKQRAITDAFTGLFNRRYLDNSLEMLIAECVRNKQELSFAMVDIDHFGTLNKNYGAKFCDDLLLDVVAEFKNAFESDDILIRYGGDEFCFIINGSSDHSFQHCHTVCKKLNDIKYDNHKDLKISCSIGLSTYTEGMTADNLIKHADKALYKAKENGRNQVIAY